METIADFLARISWPIVSRVVGALGVGTVTYTGADAALTAALTHAKNAVLGISGDVLSLLSMAGFFDAMSITAGGIMSSLSWMVLKRFALQSTGS